MLLALLPRATIRAGWSSLPIRILASSATGLCICYSCSCGNGNTKYSILGTSKFLTEAPTVLAAVRHMNFNTSVELLLQVSEK